MKYIIFSITLAFFFCMSHGNAYAHDDHKKRIKIA